LSTRKSPAATSGAKITVGDIEAAERDQITAASLRLQQATTGPPAPEVTPDTARVLAVLDRLEARPTSEEVASAQAQARLADVARRNADGADDCRAYADRMRASGYQGWTGGER
jgi:hypothetical protein